jgi:hypothetical protein
VTGIRVRCRTCKSTAVLAGGVAHIDSDIDGFRDAVALRAGLVGRSCRARTDGQFTWDIKLA